MADANSIPWYKSAVLQGLIASIVAQVLAKSNLASVITPDQGVAIVNDILDGLSALALAYAAHARVAKPLPAVTLTQKSADTANTASATASKGESNAPTPPNPPAV